MHPSKFAGLFGLAALAAHGAQAQSPPTQLPTMLDPIVVTATRSLKPDMQTVRDTIVITRTDLEGAGNLSLGEVLQRNAGIEFRGTGGPGQPGGLFIRGSTSGQTLVLIDGVRVNNPLGTTSIENIPLEMIERIEVVKGPVSSLYGADAIGGVVQVFTRGKKVPHFFANAGYGEDNDWRVNAGVTGVDKTTSFSLSTGYRKVDAPSATNSRNFCHDPDGDPYENVFFDGKLSQQLWNGEMLTLNGFVSQGKTHFDGCADSNGTLYDDQNKQTLYGASMSAASLFAPGWSSRLTYNFGLDDTQVTGSFPSTFKTQQDQLSWVNEFTIPGGTMLAGAEGLRQAIVESSSAFTKDHREVAGVFASVNQLWYGQRVEGSIRRDYDLDESFGDSTTGSVTYGIDWPGVGVVSYTYGEGFRMPTFFDLYGPTSDFYVPNANLRPERSRSTELGLRSAPKSKWAWRITAFDNRIEDLITYVFPTVENVKKARIRGAEANVQASWFGIDWRGALTVQRPEDDETGKRLQGRAEQFGTLSASKRFGSAWTVGASVFASGDRFDSVNESPDTRLPGYAILDARVRYQVDKRWSVELSATNLLDRKYESAVGYDAPRRGVLFTVRVDAF
jgi:vitamin B12 transporter